MVHHHTGARDSRQFPGRGDLGRRHAHAGDRRRAAARALHAGAGFAGRGDHRRGGGGALAGAARAAQSRQRQSADFLRRAGRGLRRARRADWLRLRRLDRGLSRIHHADTAHHRHQPDGRRHLQPHPAVDSALRVPGIVDRDGGPRPRAGRFSGVAGGTCARRTLLCAAGRHVSGLGNLRLQGR